MQPRSGKRFVVTVDGYDEIYSEHDDVGSAHSIAIQLDGVPAHVVDTSTGETLATYRDGKASR